jgi:pilus assembly protein CpaE
MLRAVVCATEADAASELERVLSKSGHFSQIRHVEASVLEANLEQELRIHSVQVVFLQTDGSLSALRLGRRIEQADAHPLAVAFGQPVSAEVLLQLMRAGICEYLSIPVREDAVAELVTRIERRKSAGLSPDDVPAAKLYSFLPAKPGVGTSTVAVNTSIALAARVNQPALLMDLDFSTGVVAFLLNLKPAFSALDALDRIDILDEEMLSQLVTRRDNLHILTAPDAPPATPLHAEHLERLLLTARRKYWTVFADLSGLLEEFSLGVLSESDKIYLVCTAETSVLHVTRRRLLKLTELGLRERVGVVLNRWDIHSELSASQVEKLLGAPVVAAISNDYARVQKAIKSGSPVDPETRLGSDILRLAGAIGEFDVRSIQISGITGWRSKLRGLWKKGEPEEAEQPTSPRVEEQPWAERRKPDSNLLDEQEIAAVVEACGGDGSASSHAAKLKSQLIALILLLRYTPLRIKQAILISDRDLNGSRLRAAGGEYELPDLVVQSLRTCPKSTSGYYFADPRDRRAATAWRNRIERLGEEAQVHNLAVRLELDGSLKPDEEAVSLQSLAEVLSRARQSSGSAKENPTSQTRR